MIISNFDNARFSFNDRNLFDDSEAENSFQLILFN